MSNLKFFPDMSLIQASKIAAQSGCELRVYWNGQHCEVEAVRIHDKDYIPAFLRNQCDPSGGADTEKVVRLGRG